VIEKIVAAIRSVPGVTVLHVDMGFDANRTVITFLGEAEQVTEAAYQAILRASKLIDMRKHSGEHPRMGALDVCPLIPVKNITMQETIDLSLQLAERVGTEIFIPVYLYEKSQRLSYRKKLEDIRRGEYEGWAQKIWDPLWRPDYGPALFDVNTGCTVIGARNFLLAYNINLATNDVALARQIAEVIRGSGYKTTGGVRIPGRFPTLKAIGWYMPEYGCTQVSTNITDMEATPLHVVFEAVKEEAAALGIAINGSELIGMVPEKAILDSGRYYAQHEGLSKSEYIAAAAAALGLNSVKPFIPASHILEWKAGISGPGNLF
jgi:glutamate formiminotransferase/formiminotetrahydrofolate cyclodeaminase